MKFLKRHKLLMIIALCSFFFVANNFKVFAAGSNTNIYTGDYASYYGATTDIDSLITSDIVAYGIANNAIHYLDNNNTPSISVGYIYNSDYLTTFYNNHGFNLLSNCAFFTNGNAYGNYVGQYDLSGWNTVLLATDTGSYIVLRIENNGDLALVNGNYIVSNSPLQVYVGSAMYQSGTQTWIQNDLWQGTSAAMPRMISVDSVNTNFNNLYTLQIPNNLFSYSIAPRIFFTDLDMFYSGDDYFPFTISDFTFDNRQDYFNYNYVKVNGQITNPNDPVIIPVNQNAISNLNFRDNTYYSGTIKNFGHSNYLTFNEYQLQHPENYILNFNYIITYQDSEMQNPVEFSFYRPGDNSLGYSYNLQWFLGYMTRFGNPVLTQLSSNHFYTNTGVGDSSSSLNYYINRTINRVTGTSVQYADPSGMFENIVNGVESVSNWINGVAFGSETSSSFASVVPVYGSYITKFDITGYVTITYKDNPLYSSNAYVDSYNFLTGVNSVVDSSSSENTYPSDSSSNLPVPVPGNNSSGGGVSTGGGSIAYGGNVTFNGIVQKVFEPFTLDTVTVAGVGDNWNYMIRSIQDNSDNGFWGVLQETYRIIPSQVWGWLIAAVSAILGCAVFKFYITSIRC